MEREELVGKFNELLGEYAQHKTFMDKAREQASKFSSDVIEKVIADHQIKASMIADDIQPLVPQLQKEVALLTSGIQDATQSKGDLGDRLQELELRKLIGELSAEDFDAQSAEGRETVDGADSVIADLDGDRTMLQGALDKWADLNAESAPFAVPVEAVVDEDSEPPAEDEAAEDEAAEDEAAEDEAAEDEAAEDDAAEDAPADEDAGLDGDDSVEIDADSLGFEMEVEAGDVDVAEDEEAEAVDVQVDDDSEAIAANIAVEIDGESAAEKVDGADGDEEPRRALLLYQEGTPEEQIYPFTDDVFTIGRGRDNDLQIKNDSKVSRFHCKLFRRSSNFYVEDNKSSNGTMINGELISERRLFGGEEIIIGETFFRFRIM